MEIHWDFMEMEWDLYCIVILRHIVGISTTRNFNKDFEQLRISTVSGMKRMVKTKSLTICRFRLGLEMEDFYRIYDKK